MQPRAEGELRVSAKPNQPPEGPEKRRRRRKREGLFDEREGAPRSGAGWGRWSFVRERRAGGRVIWGGFEFRDSSVGDGFGGEHVGLDLCVGVMRTRKRRFLRWVDE